MPSIKIYPPSQLPDRNVSETEFCIWKEELEVYLSQETDFQCFLEGGAYTNWQSQESGTTNRIASLQGADARRPQQQVETLPDDDLLKNRNKLGLSWAKLSYQLGFDCPLTIILCIILINTEQFWLV